MKEALERSRGKFIIVDLGHPLYAGGRYQGGDGEEPKGGEWTGEAPTAKIVNRPWRAETEPFGAVHQLLRDHQVQVVMAGDTHYFEYYRESYPTQEACGHYGPFRQWRRRRVSQHRHAARLAVEAGRARLRVFSAD